MTCTRPAVTKIAECLHTLASLTPVCTCRLNHLSSYTFPLLDSGDFAKAKCGFFGSFVNNQLKFSASAAKAVEEIAVVQSALDVSVASASSTLDSCVFTLMPVFSLFILTVGGCLFATDTQRARLASAWKFLHDAWNRCAHRNRVYDVGNDDKNISDAEIRLGVQGSARCELIVCARSSIHNIFQVDRQVMGTLV